jgi:hypothetical protein
MLVVILNKWEHGRVVVNKLFIVGVFNLRVFDEQDYV